MDKWGCTFLMQPHLCVEMHPHLSVSLILNIGSHWQWLIAQKSYIHSNSNWKKCNCTAYNLRTKNGSSTEKGGSGVQSQQVKSVFPSNCLDRHRFGSKPIVEVEMHIGSLRGQLNLNWACNFVRVESFRVFFSHNFRLILALGAFAHNIANNSMNPKAMRWKDNTFDHKRVLCDSDAKLFNGRHDKGRMWNDRRWEMSVAFLHQIIHQLLNFRSAFNYNWDLGFQSLI